MKMRKVESLDVKAGDAKALKPSGDHLMLFDLKGPLVEGGKLPLVLNFKSTGEVKVEANILSVGASGPGDDKSSLNPVNPEGAERFGGKTGGYDDGNHGEKHGKDDDHSGHKGHHDH